MNKHHIETREQALKVLRQARDWVKAGYIRMGRESISYMLLDAVEDAPYASGRPGAPKLPVKRAVVQRVLAYMCLAIGQVDPGTAHGRYKKLAKQSCWQYVTQNTFIRIFERAVEVAVEDIRENKKV